jgi:hypothetical protein
MVRWPAGDLYLHSVQTSSVAQLLPVQWAPELCPSGVKRSWREVDRSALYSAEIK